MQTPGKINHIAIIVDDMQESLTFWRDALGLELAGLRDVPDESAQVAILPLGENEIELVRPTNSDTGLAKYLAKKGPGLHHVCIEVDDIQAMLEQLKGKSVRLINEDPRMGAGGRQYVFIHPESTGGVLVELYQSA